MDKIEEILQLEKKGKGRVEKAILDKEKAISQTKKQIVERIFREKGVIDKSLSQDLEEKRRDLEEEREKMIKKAESLASRIIERAKIDDAKELVLKKMLQ